MMEGWLDLSYAADYPARLSPSASNISGDGGDTTSTSGDFRSACEN